MLCARASELTVNDSVPGAAVEVVVAVTYWLELVAVYPCHEEVFARPVAEL